WEILGEKVGKRGEVVDASGARARRLRPTCVERGRGERLGASFRNRRASLYGDGRNARAPLHVHVVVDDALILVRIRSSNPVRFLLPGRRTNRRPHVET